MTAVRAGSPQAWVVAARPRTLPVSVAPILVGTAVAAVEGGLRLGPAIAAGLGALLLQIGSNLANDAFDFEKGADTEARLGPPRAAQLGLLSPGTLKRGMLLVFALATLVGLYLTAIAGPLIVVVGVVSILAAIAYTGGPWPLGYHGLGEPAVFLFFGVVAVVGTAFVQTGTWPLLAWAAAIPVGALATAILVVNNLRDIETDRASGKHTIAVRIGRSGARWEWVGLVAVAYATTLVMLVAFDRSVGVLLPWLSLPKALALWRVVRADASGPALNEALAGTAQLAALFSLLLAIGLWW